MHRAAQKPALKTQPSKGPLTLPPIKGAKPKPEPKPEHKLQYLTFLDAGYYPTKGIEIDYTNEENGIK